MNDAIVERADTWVQQADALVNKILDSLKQGDEKQSRMDFDRLLILAWPWCSGRLTEFHLKHHEHEEVYSAVGARLWKTFQRWHDNGSRCVTLLPYLGTIVQSAASDYRKGQSRATRRIWSSLEIWLTEPNSRFSKWSIADNDYAGLKTWKGENAFSKKELSQKHRDRVRLEFADAMAGDTEWKMVRQVEFLLSRLFHHHPHPLPVEVVRVLLLDILYPYLPKSLSLDQPLHEESERTLGDSHPSPDPSPEESTIRRLSSLDLIAEVRNFLTVMTARDQVLLLLSKERDLLAIYFKPASTAEALAPLLAEAFEIPLVEARTLAVRYASQAPIPDEEIALRLRIKKEHLQVLRHRVKTRLLNSPLHTDWQNHNEI